MDRELFLKSVIKANLDINGLLKNGFCDEYHKLTDQGAGGDISSRIDLLAEEIFINNLKEFGTIISEECGVLKKSGSEYEIIIDPIDGSDNFISHFPYFGTSVALKRGSRNLISVVVNLANQDIFVKDERDLKIAKLNNLKFKNFTKNPYSKVGIFERAYRSESLTSMLKKEGIKYRSPGAFALSLAYAREVDFVLYEGDSRVYDIEAGLHICSDLFVHKDENFILVSKDKENFDRIHKIVSKIVE